eukprot:6177003-Pleurochrysis_carterae.AAC.2
MDRPQANSPEGVHARPIYTYSIRNLAAGAMQCAGGGVIFRFLTALDAATEVFEAQLEEERARSRKQSAELVAEYETAIEGLVAAQAHYENGGKTERLGRFARFCCHLLGLAISRGRLREKHALVYKQGVSSSRVTSSKCRGAASSSRAAVTYCPRFILAALARSASPYIDALALFLLSKRMYIDVCMLCSICLAPHSNMPQAKSRHSESEVRAEAASKEDASAQLQQRLSHAEAVAAQTASTLARREAELNELKGARVHARARMHTHTNAHMSRAYANAQAHAREQTLSRDRALTQRLCFCGFACAQRGWSRRRRSNLPRSERYFDKLLKHTLLFTRCRSVFTPTYSLVLCLISRQLNRSTSRTGKVATTHYQPLPRKP